MPRLLTLALVLIPSLAFAQPEATDEEAIPNNFGDPTERPMAPATPPAVPPPDAPRDAHGGAAGAAGVGIPGGHDAPMRQVRPRGRGHHGPHHAGHHSGQARIAVERGDNELRIECGETPIAECVEGAAPLLDLLR